jgi:hypothetical protein
MKLFAKKKKPARPCLAPVASKVLTVFCFVVAAMCMGSCHGTQAGPIAAGVVGLLATFDQLLAGGTITLQQHDAVVSGIKELQVAMTTAVTPGQAVTGGLGAVIAALTAVRAWRGAATPGKPTPVTVTNLPPTAQP